MGNIQFKNRCIDLYKLGFEKNDHQQSFGMYKYGGPWTIDFRELEQGEELWSSWLSLLKTRIKLAKNLQELEFIESDGYKFAKKQFRKNLMDKFNGLNSVYKELSKPKLGRRNITEFGLKLEGKVELLKEMLKNG